MFLCPWNFPGKDTGLPFPPPGDLPDPGIKPASLVSPALAGRFFTTAAPGKPLYVYCIYIIIIPILQMNKPKHRKVKQHS